MHDVCAVRVDDTGHVLVHGRGQGRGRIAAPTEQHLGFPQDIQQVGLESRDVWITDLTTRQRLCLLGKGSRCRVRVSKLLGLC